MRGRWPVPPARRPSPIDDYFGFEPAAESYAAVTGLKADSLQAALAGLAA
jgi:hypothetical protein